MTNQQKNTQAFLQEDAERREIEQFFDAHAVHENGEEQSVKKVHVYHDFDTLIKPGEIRLLSQPDTMTFGVLLPWDWEHYLLVPFSHYENPATNEEIFSVNGAESGGCRQVFQVWNARTVNKPLLLRSWAMGHVEDEDIHRIKSLLGNIWLGDELTQELVDLTALPIEQENDPRVRFKREELDNFHTMDEEDSALDEFLTE